MTGGTGEGPMPAGRETAGRNNTDWQSVGTVSVQ